MLIQEIFWELCGSEHEHFEWCLLLWNFCFALWCWRLYSVHSSVVQFSGARITSGHFSWHQSPTILHNCSTLGVLCKEDHVSVRGRGRWGGAIRFGKFDLQSWVFVTWQKGRFFNRNTFFMQHINCCNLLILLWLCDLCKTGTNVDWNIWWHIVTLSWQRPVISLPPRCSGQPVQMCFTVSLGVWPLQSCLFVSVVVSCEISFVSSSLTQCVGKDGTVFGVGK